MRPIRIEFTENKNDLKHVETVELVELINFLFSDSYKLTVQKEEILFDLKKQTNNWYDFKDYEIFKKDFFKQIDKGNKNGSYEVKLKRTNITIEWAYFNTKEYNGINELRLFRFISNGNYLLTYFHNGQTNEEIDLLKTNLGQLYEAVPILGTSDYNVGNPIEIEILKKLESNKYRFDLSELDRISEFAKNNNLQFRLREIENN